MKWIVGIPKCGVGLLMAVVLATLGVVRPAAGQAVRLGVLMDLPRQLLETAWTDEARQVERAYCVTDWSYGVYHVSRAAPIQDDTVFRVFEIRDADATNAGPSAVDFECPDGMPELHIHTPTTCMGDDVTTCVSGGLNAYSCQPSRGDLEKLVRRRDPFGVLQCDLHAFRFYYASEYGPPNVVASGPGPQHRVGNLTPAMRYDTPVSRPAADPGSGSRAAP
jgi:hypothetical protein